MYKLFRAMLIVHFARDSTKPLTNALCRIAAAYICAILFGKLLAHAVERVDLPLGVPVAVALVLTIGFGFTVSGLVMLTLSGSQVAVSRGASFSKIVWLTPLENRWRWLIESAPSLIILGTVAIFLGYPLGAVVSTMDLPTVTLHLGWLAGLASGYGLVLLKQPRQLVFKGFAFVGMVSLGLWLVDRILSSETLRAQSVISYLAIALLLVPLVGVYQSLFGNRQAAPTIEFTQFKQLIPGILPESAWFLVKIWRNRRTRSSLLLALTFSVLLAVSITVRHKVFDDPYAVVIVAAILAATFACDVRGVMRRHKPPEMILINGVKGIVRAETVTVGLVGCVIGMPLLNSLIGQVNNAWNFIWFFVCLQLFSSLAGLLASTALVPASGELGSQFLSAVLATSSLVVFPKLSGLSNVAYANQSAYWLMAGIGLGGITFVIETKRRNNYGRT